MIDGTSGSEAKRCQPTDVSVVVLERDRHEDLIRELREAGAKVNLIRDGDVAPAIAAARGGTGVDLLMGIGGTPEGVISAAAIKCIGGELVARLWPRDDDERRAALEQGYDLDRQLTTEDLVRSDNCMFAATGVTDGDVLAGVHFESAGTATTESLVMRSRSGTVRRISARHDRAKMRALLGAR